MEVQVTGNFKEYSDALKEYIAASRRTCREIIKQQARLLGQRLIKFTPPRTLSEGKKRVDADIRKVILGLDDTEAFEHPQAVLKNDNRFVKLFVKSRTVFGVIRELLKGSASEGEISSFHQPFRNREGDIVGRPLPDTVEAGPANKPEWKQVHKLTVRRDPLEAYIDSVQTRVGSAKGGWGASVEHLGGKLPAWIHRNTGAGSYVDRLNDDNPSFTLINNSPWAGNPDARRVVDNAVASRVQSMKAELARGLHEHVPFREVVGEAILEVLERVEP